MQKQVAGPTKIAKKIDTGRYIPQLLSTHSLSLSPISIEQWIDSSINSPSKVQLHKLLQMKMNSVNAHFLFFSSSIFIFSARTSSESAKLSILRSALPHIDSDTLERYLEIYNGNVDIIVDELSS